jgi:hypothetical protein
MNPPPDVIRISAHNQLDDAAGTADQLVVGTHGAPEWRGGSCHA